MVAPVAFTLLALAALAVGPSISASPAVFDYDGELTYFGVYPVLEDVSFTPSSDPYAVNLHVLGQEDIILSSNAYCYVQADDDGFESSGFSIDATYPNCLVVNAGSDVEEWALLEVDLSLPSLTYWSYDEVSGFYGINVVKARSSAIPSGVYYGTLDNTLTTWYLRAPTYVLDGNNGIIDGITDGLGVIGNLGGALVNGFDGVFMNGTTLSSIGSFSFILFGLGISVGIVKKCFNWVTGRHGM